MTTVYCDKDAWAQHKSSKTHPYANWAAYAAAEDWPDEYSLNKALEKATVELNSVISLTNTNISGAAYTDYLEILCYRMTQRYFDDNQDAFNNGLRTSAFMPRDYLYERERKKLQDIGKASSVRRVGRVVF